MLAHDWNFLGPTNSIARMARDGLSFIASNGGGGVFSLSIAALCLILTGGGFAFSFTQLFLTGAASLPDPSSQYFAPSNERWLKWMMPPGEPMYGSSGMCGAVVQDHYEGIFLKPCPAGCSCHSSYESIRRRFNECMGNMTRHRAYTPCVTSLA